MKRLSLLAALVATTALAAGPGDFVRQWPVAAQAEGAYAVRLSPDIYGQLKQRDLSDLAAFNGDGEALPFGPLPPSLAPPPAQWRDAAWFALPDPGSMPDDDLSLHIARSADGRLTLDASLSHGSMHTVPALLVDVRGDDQEVEAISFDLAPGAADFSAEVAVDASEDLQHWRSLVPGAMLAQLRQGGQVLARRSIELPAQTATYLRVRVVSGGPPLPVQGVQLQMRADGRMALAQSREWLAAELVRQEGRAYFYRLPAPIPADRLDVRLDKANGLANFSVASRRPDDQRWNYVGQLTSFRLRGAGLTLDNEPLPVAPARTPEWRIESNVDLSEPPKLLFGYRPETWLLLTQGPPPYRIVAGSAWARRDDYPLPALVAQARAKYGQRWYPEATALGPGQEAGGAGALQAFNRDRIKSGLLWAVLLLGAAAIGWMVVRLLKAPPPAPPTPPEG